MGEVNIHVGLHKTATTYIQQLLNTYRLQLAENQIDYFSLDEIRKRTSQIKKNKATPQFSWAIKKSLSQNALLIFSEENILGNPGDCYHSDKFYPKAKEYVSNFSKKLHRLGAEKINLYICLRSYDSFYKSLYSEYLRHDPYIPFREYLKKEVMMEHCWRELMEQLSEIKYIHEIYIWEFEKFFINRNEVINILLNGYGHIIENYEIQTGHHTIRSSFSEKTIDILNKIEEIESVTPREMIAVANSMDKIFPKSNENKAFQPFNSEEIFSLKNKYKEDIAYLRQSYNFITD